MLAEESQANEIRNSTEQIRGRNEVHPVASTALKRLLEYRCISADGLLPLQLRPTPERNAPAHHLLNHDRYDTSARDLRGINRLEAIVKWRYQATQPFTNRRINVGTSQTLWSIRSVIGFSSQLERFQLLTKVNFNVDPNVDARLEFVVTQP